MQLTLRSGEDNQVIQIETEPEALTKPSTGALTTPGRREQDHERNTHSVRPGRRPQPARQHTVRPERHTPSNESTVIDPNGVPWAAECSRRDGTQQDRTDELLAEHPLTNADTQAAVTRKAITSEAGQLLGSAVHDLDIPNAATIDARLRVRLSIAVAETDDEKTSRHRPTRDASGPRRTMSEIEHAAVIVPTRSPRNTGGRSTPETQQATSGSKIETDPPTTPGPRRCLRSGPSARRRRDGYLLRTCVFRHLWCRATPGPTFSPRHWPDTAPPTRGNAG